MKTLMNGLLKGRITRWGFLAVLLIAVGASVGWKNQRAYTNWAGVWIGSDGAGMYLECPANPARPSGANSGPPGQPDDLRRLAGLLAALGATLSSDAVGEVEMISRDTGKYGTMVLRPAAGEPAADQRRSS